MTEQDIPDIFTDGITAYAGPFGLSVTFHLSTPQSAAAKDDPGPAVVRVRMNAELAEALAKILNNVVEADRKARLAKPKPVRGNGK